ncbi:MAG: MaoC family dehydratase [Gammaproteobacteria bacterium]
MTARSVPRYEEIAVGDVLPALVLPPITRAMLAVYCGASGDHNPVHVDIDFARESGLEDVIAHGMLVMAYSGRVLTNWVPQTAILSFDTRFLAVTRVGDAITATAEIIEKLERNGCRLVRLAVAATDQHGEVKTSGHALVALAACRT